MTSGVIKSIQTYSLHDGPGLRSLVFLKGCPLRCAWCCNPEGRRAGAEVEFYLQKCTGCGSCLKTCRNHAINADLRVSSGFKIDRTSCDDCGECVRTCPSGALRLVGVTMTVRDVMAEIRKDKYFYMTSGGGVTLSGGEPLYQFDFALALLKSLHRANYETGIETCGYVSWPHLEQALAYADFLLFDLKHVDPLKHREGTGVSNRLILSNLRKLSGRPHGVPVIVRIPLVPGFNLDLRSMRAAAAFVAKLGNVEEVHLMPFHQLGKDKYRRLSEPYALNRVRALESHSPMRDRIGGIRHIFESHQLAVKIGG